MFIDTVRKYAGEERAVKKAIDECIEKGILEEYLKRKGSEVRNMLIAEYSYEKDIEVKQREAKQEGLLLSAHIFQAVQRNPGASNTQIAYEVGCTEEEVQSTRKMFGI